MKGRMRFFTHQTFLNLKDQRESVCVCCIILHNLRTEENLLQRVRDEKHSAAVFRHSHVSLLVYCILTVSGGKFAIHVSGWSKEGKT